jgi:hypothetical protein
MTRQSIQPTMDPIALVAALNANFNELYTGSGAGPAWVKVGALAAAALPDHSRGEAETHRGFRWRIDRELHSQRRCQRHRS